MDFNDFASIDLKRKDVDFVCDHETGRAWIVHGKPLTLGEDVAHVRFTKATGLVTLVAATGREQTIPVPVKEPLASTFATAEQVSVIWSNDKGDILGFHNVPMHTV